ncbi:MAG TPA: pyridoxal phosphate-dependent aminotransferase, partial [Vicinamibacteria bacterium]
GVTTARRKARPATPLARRVLRLEVSPTVAMAARATALRSRGVFVYDFSVGEPDQGTPRHVAAAGVAAIEAGRTRYAPAPGLNELRAAVAARYRQDFQVAFAPEEVAITVGGKQALYLAGQALLDAGDEVIVPSPCWPTFTEAVRLAGGRPVLAPTREADGFAVTARLLGKAVGPRTRAMILNSPCNPTGAVVEPEELLAIGGLARRRGFTLVYDDTYAQLAFSRPRDGGLQALRDLLGDRLVILGTASKSYCMTGWRIGWVLGPRALVDACAALASHSTQSPATFAQLGAVTALTGPQEFVGELLAEYRRRRDFVHPALLAIPGVSCVEPQGGFYAFPNLSRYLGREIPTTLELGRRLLEEKHVAVVPGEGFGAPGYVRISFARPLEELREGMRRIAEFLTGQGTPGKA